MQFSGIFIRVFYIPQNRIEPLFRTTCDRLYFSAASVGEDIASQNAKYFPISLFLSSQRFKPENLE